MRVPLPAARRMSRFILDEFCADGVGGGCGVFGLENGSADDDKAGACGGGLCGGQDAFLLVAGTACGADAGGDEDGFVADGFSEGSEFEGGADEAANAGIDGESGEVQDLFFGLCLYVDLTELLVVHRGKNSDAEEGELGGVFGAGLFGPADHFGASGGVQGEHFDGECGDALHGFGDGVGDVVKLEVEEDAVPAVGDLPDEVGPIGGK